MENCVPFPDAKDEDIYMTDTYFAVGTPFPLKAQIEFKYPVELADGSTSFYVFDGMYEQTGRFGDVDFVLVGGPPGADLTGSLSGIFDVALFPDISFIGDLVICQVESVDSGAVYAVSSNVEGADAKEQPNTGYTMTTVSSWAIVSMLVLWSQL